MLPRYIQWPLEKVLNHVGLHTLTQPLLTPIPNLSHSGKLLPKRIQLYTAPLNKLSIEMHHLS